MDISQFNPDLYNGFGISTDKEVQQLLKALEVTAGQSTDISTYNSATALQPQSLEDSLVLLTAQESHASLWKNVPKGSATSTLEEYSVQTGYGQQGGWVGQMETPEESDPNAQRKFGVMKFLRQQWKFSDVAGMVNSITPIETWAKQSSIQRLIRQANRSLYSGNSLLIPTEIDGFEYAIRTNGSSAHVIDMRGAIPTQDVFDNAGQLIMDNFGNPNAKLFTSPAGLNTINNIMKNNGQNTTQRISQGQIGADGSISIGTKVKDIHTAFGTLELVSDIYIGSEYEAKTVSRVPNPSNPQTLVEGATSVRAPLTPVLTSVTPISSPVAGSKWSTSGSGGRVAGAYRYRVQAKNQFGTSLATSASNAETVVSGGALDIVITPNPNSAYPATCFEVFSEAQPGTGVYLYTGSVASNGLAPVTFRDVNQKIPGTTCYFILDLTSTGTERTFLLKRLAPVFSQEFAKIGMYRWGVMNLYCVPQYYAPLRFVLIENVPVGVRSTSPLLNV
jgi:hypothetical protein